ncbi:riboflavin synthase [Alkalicoccus chagannorensis]|uniref:riboflavin synthase n=1 Tax=Alkalicoccus chagannorensis TaxID=427072 RepID=UPI000424410C|nr:riboflavin synthase [Alkalicoccus chagannorensis]
MFTGIIEEKGTIRTMQETGDAVIMSVHAPGILDDVKLGDSISVNGVCLTVSDFTKETFTADLMPETVRATSLRDLGENSHVNLERAMASGGRFGGHFVSGHVDGTGTIVRKESDHNAVYYDIEVDPTLRPYLTLKGSVAVDGTSLTVFNTGDKMFTISIIPHTLDETIIGSKSVGDIVNIECDMLAKYVEELLEQRFKRDQGEPVTKEFLREHGF